MKYGYILPCLIFLIFPHQITSYQSFFIHQHEDLSESAVKTFKAEVESHGCEMYILTPIKESYSVMDVSMSQRVLL